MEDQSEIGQFLPAKAFITILQIGCNERGHLFMEVSKRKVVTAESGL